MKNSKSMNLLEGSLWDKILIFAIPYALTCVLEQLFNATDVAVVGFYVLNSFGQACTTFAAQNNGAGNEKGVRKALAGRFFSEESLHLSPAS